MNWLVGRQHSTGVPYYKLPLLVSKKFKFDVYILKYPTGSKIDWHTDPAEPGHAHHRLNIILNKAVGGEFQTIGNSKTTSKRLCGRVIEFRPDVTTHRVTEIISGTRYILSIGWLRRIR